MIALWQPRIVVAFLIWAYDGTYLPIFKGVEKNFKGNPDLEGEEFNIVALWFTQTAKSKIPPK